MESNGWVMWNMGTFNDPCNRRLFHVIPKYGVITGVITHLLSGMSHQVSPTYWGQKFVASKVRSPGFGRRAEGAAASEGSAAVTLKAQDERSSAAENIG